MLFSSTGDPSSMVDSEIGPAPDEDDKQSSLGEVDPVVGLVGAKLVSLGDDAKFAGIEEVDVPGEVLTWMLASLVKVLKLAHSDLALTAAFLGGL